MQSSERVLSSSEPSVHTHGHVTSSFNNSALLFTEGPVLLRYRGRRCLSDFSAPKDGLRATRNVETNFCHTDSFTHPPPTLFAPSQQCLWWKQRLRGQDQNNIWRSNKTHLWVSHLSWLRLAKLTTKVFESSICCSEHICPKLLFSELWTEINMVVKLNSTLLKADEQLKYNF